MTIFRLSSIALSLLFFASLSYAEEVNLPDSAEITRNKDAKIIGVRIVGDSNLQPRIVSPETIRELSKLAHFESLSFWGTTVDDDDLVQLKPLENLRSIDLSFSQVTGKSIEVLSTHKKLALVNLTSCHVTDDHLAALSKMPQIAMLHLGRTNVTDNGLKHLDHLEQIVLLDLENCEISDTGLKSIGDLPVIQSLWLSKTVRHGNGDRSALTDNCVEYLATLNSLLDLRIADSQITDAKLKELRTSLPNTKVSTERTGITYTNR